MGRAGWADAATIVPWAIYESYGSDEVLVRQLDSMRRWVASLEARARRTTACCPTEFQFGDWLDPDAPGDKPWEAKVSSDFVANAFFAHSARLLADAERLVGDGAAPSAPTALAERVATATWDSMGAQRRSRPRPAPRSRSSSASRPTPERERIGEGLARQRPRRARAHRHGLPRNAARAARPRARRPHRRGVPDAAPPRGAVVAVPGRDGRDHHLGALGCAGSRRHHPLGRHGDRRQLGDALVQPLRVRRGSRLDLPVRRRHRPDRRPTRVPTRDRRAAAGDRRSPGRRRPWSRASARCRSTGG